MEALAPAPQTQFPQGDAKEANNTCTGSALRYKEGTWILGNSHIL